MRISSARSGQGNLQFHRDSQGSLIDAQAGFHADHQQVHRVRQGLPNSGPSPFHGAKHEHVGSKERRRAQNQAEEQKVLPAGKSSQQNRNDRGQQFCAQKRLDGFRSTVAGKRQTILQFRIIRTQPVAERGQRTGQQREDAAGSRSRRQVPPLVRTNSQSFVPNGHRYPPRPPRDRRRGVRPGTGPATVSERGALSSRRRGGRVFVRLSDFCPTGRIRDRRNHGTQDRADGINAASSRQARERAGRPGRRRRRCRGARRPARS